MRFRLLHRSTGLLAAVVLLLGAVLGLALFPAWTKACLLYTSDAADERSSVDLGGRRIIKKKKIRYPIVTINRHSNLQMCYTSITHMM